MKIALAGNPNSGKTTLFNALTGSNQYVGNWPGVTVEKKEGKLIGFDDVVITDLPGIYSLSPYTLEEVVARNYLCGENPDAILNIVDGTNIERNLYLTTQLMELGCPVVIAINMMDVVEKRGDSIDTEVLSQKLGCRIVRISALKEKGIKEAANVAIEEAKKGNVTAKHLFSGEVEHALAHIEEAFLHELPEEKQRWYAVKIFERDKKVLEELKIPENVLEHIETDIKKTEEIFDDDSEAIIINERYTFVEKILKDAYTKKDTGKLSGSARIDNFVTHRLWGLPIFALIMFLVYYISMVSVGSFFTNWANNGVFGDGWHLFGIGESEYRDSVENYGDSNEIILAFSEKYMDEDPSFLFYGCQDIQKAKEYLSSLVLKTPIDSRVEYKTLNEETLEVTLHDAVGKISLENAVKDYLNTDYKPNLGQPMPENYGVWIKGIPVIIGNVLSEMNVADWLSALILKGMVAGVGAVLGFLPQMAVLFFLLAFLEACGYMSRIAFVLDRLFRKFGLSGKSFIPMLIGTGCGVTGIMASRTIENERDRKMTIMTTTFIPCGAKVPFISMIAGAIFGGSAIVATSAYFVGMAAIIISGLILKKTKMFKGDESPFVMELPEYHLPTAKSVLSTTWERVWSFVKKAGSVILISTMAVWFLTYFGFDNNGNFRMLGENELGLSFLAKIGGAIAFLFKPLGWGMWQTAVAAITGIVAKENVVGTIGVLFGGSGNLYATLASEVFTPVSAFSFMTFNILCAPCIAAIGAIRREMNSTKWMWITIGYQTLFAYCVSYMINQFGNAFCNKPDILGIAIASAIFALIVFLAVKPDNNRETLRR